MTGTLRVKSEWIHLKNLWLFCKCRLAYRKSPHLSLSPLKMRFISKLSPFQILSPLGISLKGKNKPSDSFLYSILHWKRRYIHARVIFLSVVSTPFKIYFRTKVSLNSKKKSKYAVELFFDDNFYYCIYNISRLKSLLLWRVIWYCNISNIS